MKKIFTLFLSLLVFAGTFAASIPTELPIRKASEVMIPIGNMGQTISLMDFSRMKVSAYEKISGKHLNFIQKMEFKVAQKSLRNSINPDGTINNAKLGKAMHKADNSGISKGLYIVLAILGLAWIAMGVMDNWKGNNWWVNLILTLLFWLPGFIHAMIKMKDYYK
jgi:uncharacterized membrane protein YqaE (UPF0057 family)